MSLPLRLKKREWDINNSGYTVIFDACTLYPAPLRDILMELSAAGLFRAKWTDEIQEEWISNLLKKRPELQRTQLERTRDWELAQSGRVRTRRSDQTVPRSPYPQQTNPHRRDRRMAARPKRHPHQSRLAILNQKCSHQTQASIPVNLTESTD